MNGRIGDEELLKVRDVAKMFQVTSYTVRTWLRDGKLEGFTINKQWRVPRSSVQKLANQMHGDED